jgi:hypothetical protein
MHDIDCIVYCSLALFQGLMVVAILLLEILLGHYILGVGVNYFSFKDGTFF